MTNAQQIAVLVADTVARDARSAVRQRARELIEQFCSAFGEPTLPLDMEVLASMRGIRQSEECPVHSPDAELVPDADGGVHMRVNPDRPETRRRFSMAHEIGHTFFPGYALTVQCRPDPRHRDPDNPDDLLEMLCDVAAAELLFPLPWFAADALSVGDAAGLATLAEDYRASREATLRRFAETSPRCLAAVFFAWKLKPTQQRTVGRTDQASFFGTSPEHDARAARRLRIDYSISSPAFADAGHFLPKDKSVATDGPFAQAARGGCADGECHLDLGAAGGTYRVMAVPLYTMPEERGPAGELGVAAILEPLKVKQPKKSSAPADRSLFD